MVDWGDIDFSSELVASGKRMFFSPLSAKHNFADLLLYLLLEVGYC